MRPQFSLCQQLCHADDAIHRGADLVAHVGQEGTLRAAGGFRRFFSLPHRFQRLFLVRDVQYPTDDGLSLGSLNWAEPDFDREFRAIFANSEQLQIGSHRSLDRSFKELVSLCGMRCSKLLWHENFDRLSDQLRVGVAE